MIAAPGKFVMTSPTKCGTQSLHALANATHGMEWFRTNHMTDVPSKYSTLPRWLMVRNPYSRLVSMYSFLTRQRQWAARPIHQANGGKGMTFDQFVRFMREQRAEHLDSPKATSLRAPWVYIWSLSEFSERFFEYEMEDFQDDGKDRVFKLEEADDVFLHALGEVGLKPGRKKGHAGMYHSNTSDADPKKRGEWTLERFYNKPGTLEMVNDMWAERDCELFNYSFWS